MRNIWVISDTHFGHENIIKYCNRPFDNVKQMDECIADNWNQTVKPEDYIYHLGDVYFGDSTQIPRLNGHKRLVLGNHDTAKNPVLQAMFEKITVWRLWAEYGLLFSHVPLHESALTSEKRGTMVNVHGHIHEKASPDGPYINVCVEQTNYKPIHIDEISQRLGLRNGVD